MSTLVGFVVILAPFIYILAGVGIFFSIRGVIVARRERRVAAFGLERDAATQKQRRSLTTMITLILVVGIVYIVSNIISPNLNTAGSVAMTPTPAETAVETNGGTPTPLPLLYPTQTPIPGFPDQDAGEQAAAQSQFEKCAYPGIFLNAPQPGDIVTGQVSVEGEANVFPFFEYKFEVRGPNTAEQWVTLARFENTRSEGVLGSWDSTSLPPGDYVFRLIVYSAPETALPPCEVPLTVEAPS